MPLAGNVDLKSQELRALVKQYGRIAACLPVEKGDPLRTQLLDAVRENYVGDLNRKTTLNNTPVPSFVVTQLCAAQKYAYFVANLPMPMLTGIVRIVKSWMWYCRKTLIIHGGCPFLNFRALVAKAHWHSVTTAPTFCQSKRLKKWRKNGNSVACGKAIPCHCAEYWQSKKRRAALLGG